MMNQHQEQAAKTEAQKKDIGQQIGIAELGRIYEDVQQCAAAAESRQGPGQIPSARHVYCRLGTNPRNCFSAHNYLAGAAAAGALVAPVAPGGGALGSFER